MNEGPSAVPAGMPSIRIAQSVGLLVGSEGEGSNNRLVAAWIHFNSNSNSSERRERKEQRAQGAASASAGSSERREQRAQGACARGARLHRGFEPLLTWLAADDGGAQLGWHAEVHVPQLHGIAVRLIGLLRTRGFNRRVSQSSDRKEQVERREQSEQERAAASGQCQARVRASLCIPSSR